MNTPSVYTPEQIRSEPLTNIGCLLSDGRNVAARPIGFPGISLRKRLHMAWMVFTGRWDALRWEGQE